MTMNICGIVTTPGRPSLTVKAKAKRIAEKWNLPFEERQKRSIPLLQEQFNTTVFVVSSQRIEAFEKGRDEPFFFHPNGAMFRAKRWHRNGDDPLVHACKIERGDTVVDATLGLASDAQLASMAVGKGGQVIGLESSPVVAQLVKEGLKTYESHFSPLDQAMRRIEVVCTDHLKWLRTQPHDSVDIIYFDPMFQEKVNTSDGVKSLRYLSNNNSLMEETMEQAKKVARKRIVLKDHFRSHLFQQLGFTVQVRPSATYHFGVIELEKSESYD
ncbi:class I SAM-dependent methyltransferase [Salipaludibacillus keqinensis]|nr:class I SAM-dependent methyltransferase [Salipaludibacillus keqinensis]